MRLIDIEVPDIGDFREVAVIDILVAVGDIVGAEQSLIVLETDKATLEVPSPADGTVRALKVNRGDKVGRGSAVLALEVRDAAAAPPAVATSAPPPPPPAPPAAPAPSPLPPLPQRDDAPPHASPSIRLLARELGVDLGRVTGTGPKGRILREDVQGFVAASLRVPAGASVDPGQGLDLLPWPSVDFARFGPVERAPLSKIRRISGANLARNAVIIPHVTNFDEADVTELDAFRQVAAKETGTKLTLLAFLVKAGVTVLKKFPEFNASLDGDDLILKRYYHIGFAADTPAGLVVPVIRDADAKGVVEIAADMARLSALARDGKLKPADMQGGSFTISSLGGIGGTGFTPIINAPEVAILGAARTRTAPVWDGTQFRPRLMMPVSLSWDHRVVDGAVAARFLVHLCSLLADFRRILL